MLFEKRFKERKIGCCDRLPGILFITRHTWMNESLFLSFTSHPPSLIRVHGVSNRFYRPRLIMHARKLRLAGRSLLRNPDEFLRFFMVVDWLSADFATNSCSSVADIIDNYPILICRDDRENPCLFYSRLDEIFQFRTALSSGAGETRVQGHSRDKQVYQQIFVQFVVHTTRCCIVYQCDFCRIRKPE